MIPGDGPGKPEDSLDATEEHRERLLACLQAHPYGDQDENGIDLSLLRENLKLTPAQRLDRLQQVYDFYWKVRRAREK